MLLKLPGEVRNYIYGLLLIAPPPGTPRPLGSNLQIHPQILIVCRQVHHEAAAVLYGKNTFIAHYSLLSSLPQLRRWQHPITCSTLISMIRRYHIYVRLDCDARFTAEMARDAFTGKEELTIEVFQSQFDSSDHTVLRLFEEVREVHRARIFGSITAFPEYTYWLENVMMSPKDESMTEYGQNEKEMKRDLWTVRATPSQQIIKLILFLVWWPVTKLQSKCCNSKSPPSSAMVSHLLYYQCSRYFLRTLI